MRGGDIDSRQFSRTTIICHKCHFALMRYVNPLYRIICVVEELPIYWSCDVLNDSKIDPIFLKSPKMVISNDNF